MTTLPAHLYLQHNIKALLDKVGEREKCDRCNRPVWLLKQKDGKIEVYNDTAALHFAVCPKTVNQKS